MLKRVRKAVQLGKIGCFSPEAMLATMVLEFGGALWVALRYRLNKVGWLTIGLLVFLGGMQMSEFILCGLGGGFPWYHIAYASITMLPPLGISLAMAIAGKKNLWAQIVMYVLCAAFVLYWLFAIHGVTGDKCEAPSSNWVVFQANTDAMWMYGTYYYVFLAIGTFVSLYWGYKADNHRTSWALYWLAIGYAVFILPTITVGLIDPATRSGIPSVMCGFAALLAVTLIFAVIRLAGTRRGETPAEVEARTKASNPAQAVHDDN
ncbi:hypothetical protein FYJ24_08125 [Actinomycetaceae bacterium WB03_NA08]|uniref:Uncharacterized protein n=1 Tax=Scrofimicrobium canadense TaxID=2652290 RepID=A0A6N7VSF9_9ACTO|nr:hypothetical protein [Scrofimicrobium canadense]MSS84729.1 hypothetical protein [Scrofimicrobium canadense]